MAASADGDEARVLAGLQSGENKAQHEITVLSTSTLADKASFEARVAIIKATMAELRAHTRDLELLAEEQDTEEDEERLSSVLRQHKREYERLQQAFRAANLAARRATDVIAARRRAELLAGGDPAAGHLKTAAEGDLTAASAGITDALRRTARTMAQELEHTATTLAAMDASNVRLRQAKDEYRGQAGLFGASRRLLRTLWSQSVWDAAALYGGVALFLAVAAGIAIRRSSYFVPVGALLAPVTGRLWNATRAAGGGAASVFRRPTPAPAADGAAAQQRAPPDDSMWAESDWELDEDAEADAPVEGVASTADGAEPLAEELGVDSQPAPSAGTASTADSRVVDDSVHSTAQSPAPRPSEPGMTPGSTEPAVGDVLQSDDDTASLQQPEQEAPTTVSALDPEGTPEPAPGQDAAGDAHQTQTQVQDEQDDVSAADDAASSLPPAIVAQAAAHAARLAEVEASYQEAREAVERATSAHEAALQRAATASPGSEAAASAEREVDAAAAEHSAAIEAAQAALRQAAALQEAADADEDADEAVWGDAETEVQETADLDEQLQPEGTRTVPGADAAEGAAAEPALIDNLSPAEPAAPAMPAADSAVKHPVIDANSQEAAGGARPGSVPSSDEPADSSSSSATQEPELQSAPAPDLPPAAKMDATSALADAEVSGMTAEPAVVAINASSDPVEVASTGSDEERSLEQEVTPQGAADAAELAAMEWRWEGSDEFPKGRWVERPVSEPEEPGAEMAWFWVTGHESTDGSWQLRIIRDNIVPATPLTAGPMTDPVTDQSQEAAADQTADDMASTASHDEL